MKKKQKQEVAAIEMKSIGSVLASVMIAMLILTGAFFPGQAQGINIKEWDNAGADNSWGTDANWDPSGVPVHGPDDDPDRADITEINMSGDDRAIADYDTAWINGLFVGHGEGNTGELEIVGTDAGVKHTNHGSERGAYIGRRGGTGIVNMNSDGGEWRFMFGHLRIGGRDDDGGPDSDGTLNLYDGYIGGTTVRVAQRGTGLLNIEGGVFGRRPVDEVGETSPNTVNIHEGGTFRVGGSGADEINISNLDLAGTLDLQFDSDGITMIDVHDDGNVEFQPGAELDLGWVDAPVYGTWTVMTWEGDLTGENNLSFAPGVDENIWSYEFHEGNSGSLSITAIPEPSSLVLLGLAGLLLMKRRRV